MIEATVLLVSDEDERVQVGATWLLKRLAEDGVSFKSEHLVVLCASLPDLSNWQSKLHFCQMLQHLRIPRESAGSVVSFLERNVRNENKFLRAWCYSGFYELAKQHGEYIQDALEQIDRGETDKAASVQARIRKIRKAIRALGWL